MLQNRCEIHFDNKALNEKIIENLNTIQNLPDMEFNHIQVQKFLKKKLELENKYWKQFRNNIFLHIKRNSFVVIKGLPFDSNNILSIGLSSMLGIPVLQNNRDSGMVRKIKPREGYNHIENFPHTDSVYWPEPNDLTTTECVRRDQNGLGSSRIVPIELVLEKLKEENLLRIVKEFTGKKVPFTLDPRFGKSGMHMQHILTRSRHSGRYHFQIRFDRMLIEECIRDFHINLQKATLEAIFTFEEIVSKLGKQNEFLLEEGDWLLIDNKCALHNKSPTSPKSTRLFKRIKINIDRERLYDSNLV